MLVAERQKLSLKINDQVQVIAGREKGKIGKVLRIDSKNFKITLEQINLVKKHNRKSSPQGTGTITLKEMPLSYSNVLLFCKKCERGVRHGSQRSENEKASRRQKIRVCKRCNESLESA